MCVLIYVLYVLIFQAVKALFMSRYMYFSKAQTRLQKALDNANGLVTSGGTADRIDVAACTKAVQRLESTLSDVTAAGLGEGSPVVTAAKELLVSKLNVRTHFVRTHGGFRRIHVFDICLVSRHKCVCKRRWTTQRI